MSTISTQGCKTQLVLFGERLAVPRWQDLSELTHAEVVRLLAQLLLCVRAGNPSRASQSQGDRDE
jgi:hypothetical protein